MVILGEIIDIICEQLGIEADEITVLDSSLRPQAKRGGKQSSSFLKDEIATPVGLALTSPGKRDWSVRYIEEKMKIS